MMHFPLVIFEIALGDSNCIFKVEDVYERRMHASARKPTGQIGQLIKMTQKMFKTKDQWSFNNQFKYIFLLIVLI